MKKLLAKKASPALVFSLAWAASVSAFWLGARSDAMGYSLLFLYLVLPAATLACSIALGKDLRWGAGRWAVGAGFAIMHPVAGYATFGLANALSTGYATAPTFESLPMALAIAAAGLGIGAEPGCATAKYQ